MTFQQHAAVSLALSGILYLIFRSWSMSAASFISGVLIDLDYVIDYVAQCSSPCGVKDFLRMHREGRLLKVRLFHGWEWLCLLGAAAWMTAWNDWFTGAFLGLGIHLFLDTINFGEPFLSYSMLWRWRKGFRAEKLFKRSMTER
ncbi:MAG: hypothetical protein JSU90_06075 [Nitrospiraceae bacterium]|nr:MAG: hypothetical protein JSU90_06075 [Nitrospiraceae bacterium]